MAWPSDADCKQLVTVAPGASQHALAQKHTAVFDSLYVRCGCQAREQASLQLRTVMVVLSHT